MNVETINPFIESVHETFETMLGSSVQHGEVSVGGDGNHTGDILALIGVTGDSKGTVSLSFPTETALRVVSQIIGMEFESVDETVVDGIAEMINIIAGGAKAKFSSYIGKPMDLGLPTVVRGKDYHIDFPKKTIWLEVPFETGLGPFTMGVTFESPVPGS